MKKLDGKCEVRQINSKQGKERVKMTILGAKFQFKNKTISTSGKCLNPKLVRSHKLSGPDQGACGMPVVIANG